MLKYTIALILLSLGVIFGTPQIQPLILALVSAHNWISQLLLQVFSGGEAGNIIRQLLSLLAVPVFIGLIPTVVYGMAKRRLFPYFMQTIGIVWLLQTTAIVILYKAAA